MFNELIAQITPFIQHYGAWGVFIISIIEEIIAPIPSTFSLLAAGFFLLPSGGPFGSVILQCITYIVIPGGLGLAIGSLFVYALAYLGGEPVIKRWGKWFGISWGDVEKINKRFTGRYTDEILLFGLRAIPVFPNVLVSAVCGVLRYPIKNFFVVTFIGSGVRAFLMGILGWSLGEAFVVYAGEISDFGEYALYAILGLIVASFIYFFIRKMYKKHKVLSG
ncbi:MAG: VTT domain-containing protein [Candidatus Paceibacterota bacterium]|jgi:membrane protein DedA with SNARE-associated domain